MGGTRVRKREHRREHRRESRSRRTSEGCRAPKCKGGSSSGNEGQVGGTAEKVIDCSQNRVRVIDRGDLHTRIAYDFLSVH